MSNDLRVEGYCIPYHDVAMLFDDNDEGTFTRVMPGAFDLRNKRVEVLWASHDGEVIGETGALFSDAYGLGFAFSADRDANIVWFRSITRGTDPQNRCSIAMAIDEADMDESYLGRPLRTVHRADLRHITIGLAAPGRPDRAAFDGAIAWLPEFVDENTPHRVLDLQSHWREGYVSHQNERIDRRIETLKYETGATSEVEGRVFNGLGPEDAARLSEMLAQRGHPQVLMSVARSVRGISASGGILGHAALHNGVGLSQLFSPTFKRKGEKQ
jgi:Caudovirus prohead serine protease